MMWDFGPWSSSLRAAFRYKEAPLAWIFEQCRLRIAAIMLQWVFADLYFCYGARHDEGRIGEVIGSQHEQMEWMRWTSAACAAVHVLGVVLLLTKMLPPHYLEAYLCSTVLLEIILRTLHSKSYTVCYLFILSMIGVGVRLRPLVATMLVSLLANGFQRRFVNNLELDLLWGISSTLWLTLAALTAKSQQSELRCLFDAQQSLAVQSKASVKLLSMVCDAACWLAADGLTILGSDPRLEEIFGRRVAGTQFSSYLLQEERGRFCSATGPAGARQAQDAVVLLPSTLAGAGPQPYQVDLFIADVRAELDSAGDRDRPGFLVGIRLAVPDQAALAMARDAPETAVTRLPSSDARRVATGSGVFSSCGGDSASLPETLRSAELLRPVLHRCTREAVRETLLTGACEDELPSVESPRARDTALATLELVCDHALGGALVCVADAKAYHQVFSTEVSNAPSVRSSDQGYMTDCLRGIHVSDARFRDAFREFTRHAQTDRWPEDHSDERARGRPKDGAFRLSTDGYRVQCSAKLLGLAPAAIWENVGTKHEAAMACAWSIPGALVFVKSDSGPLHLVMRQGTTVHVYHVSVDV